MVEYFWKIYFVVYAVLASWNFEYETGVTSYLFTISQTALCSCLVVTLPALILLSFLYVLFAGVD